MQVIDTSQMSRPEWLELRRQSIGASDAPVIAGLSKYKSRFALYLEKTGDSVAEDMGEEAWWGQRLEGDIAARLNECDDFAGIQRIQAMVRNPAIDWMTATLDMIEDSDPEEIWEFKAAGIQTAAKLEDGNEGSLPESWILQAHHQMACATADHVNFAVFVGHRLKLYQFRVGYDPEIGDGLIQIESEFWQHVQRREPPAEFDPADAAVMLRHFKANSGVEIINESPRMLALAKQYEAAQAAAKFHDDMANQLKAALLMEMGNAPSMKLGPYQCKRQIINVKERVQTVKASCYVRFSFKNTEGSDE